MMMFSMSSKSFLLIVLCACAVSASNNGTATGAGLSPQPTDSNGTHGGFSEQAWMFLTGRVSTILLPSFYTLVCSISVPINIYALLAFARGIRPKKPAAIYMVNLAVADLLFALMLPFKISYHFEGNNWKFGQLMCRVVTAAFYWNMYCSVLLIACISVDRLLAIVYPIKSLTWRSPQNTVIACVSVWIISLAGSVPLITSEQTFDLSKLNITTCHDVHSLEKITFLKIYFLILCCIFFFLPLLITVVSYTRVIWSLSRLQHDTPEASHKRTRAMMMALVVVLIFVLCFMPTNCFLLAHYLQLNGLKMSREATDDSYILYQVFLCLGSLNCLLDPLLYYFGSSQCQKQLSNMLKCKEVTERSGITHLSDSWRFSSKPILKSRKLQDTESSEMNSPVTKVGSFQLRPQNKKTTGLTLSHTELTF